MIAGLLLFAAVFALALYGIRRSNRWVRRRRWEREMGRRYVLYWLGGLACYWPRSRRAR